MTSCGSTPVSSWMRSLPMHDMDAEGMTLAQAREVALRAYAPYSNFRVGAAVVAASGAVYLGCNVENAAYGSTMCAEANAIGNAIAAGESGLISISVACIDADSVDGAYPCGNCRQLMEEFGIGLVEVSAGSGESRKHQLSELFPHGFKL